MKFKLLIKTYTLIMGDFDTPLSPIDRSARPELSREIRELTDVVTKMDITNI